MGIEQELKRIADALESIVASNGPVPSKESTSDLAIPAMQEAETPAPKKAKKAKDEAPKEITMEDIGAALRAFVTTNGKDGAVRILKNYGATRLSEIKPEDFAKVLSDLKV